MLKVKHFLTNKDSYLWRLKYEISMAKNEKVLVTQRTLPSLVDITKETNNDCSSQRRENCIVMHKNNN